MKLSLLNLPQFTVRNAAVAAVALIAIPAGAATASWPMFRGNPGLTGVSDVTLPAKLKSGWTFKTGGPVKSSAAIADGKVFIGSNDGHLYALNLDSGQKIWGF